MTRASQAIASGQAGAGSILGRGKTTSPAATSAAAAALDRLKTGLRFTVQGSISRSKLMFLRVGNPEGAGSVQVPWINGKGAQDRVLECWKGKQNWAGVLIANDVNSDKGSKEYSIMKLGGLHKMLEDAPPHLRNFYEMSYDLSDIPEYGMATIGTGQRAVEFPVKDYITPVNFHVDLEIYYAHNSLKNVEDWNAREPYYIGYIRRFMINSGLARFDSDITVVSLDSSNQEKASRHWIFKIKGKMFRSIRDCGAFSRCLEAYILSDEKLGSPQLPTHPWFMFDKDGREKTFVLDSIHSKHRCYRVRGATKKKGVPRPLIDYSGLEDLQGSIANKQANAEFRALIRSSILTPYTGPDTIYGDAADDVLIIEVFEPDGVTRAMSSTVRTKFGLNGELLGRGTSSRRILNGIASAERKAAQTVAQLIKADAYKAVSNLKWVGKGTLTADNSDFGAFKPEYANALVKDLLQWILTQSVRDLYDDVLPEVPSSGGGGGGGDDDDDDGSSEPQRKRQRLDTSDAGADGPITVEDVPLGDMFGTRIDIYRTSFSVGGSLIYSQLNAPERMCPIMHIDGRASKQRRAVGTAAQQAAAYASKYVRGMKPTSMYHESNNTGVAISLRSRKWWWTCHNNICKTKTSIRRDIPDVVWDKYASAIEQTELELKTIFTVNVPEKLCDFQGKLMELHAQRVLEAEKVRAQAEAEAEAQAQEDAEGMADAPV